MRVLVYAAGAYALCMGSAEAFAPQSTFAPALASGRTAAGKQRAESIVMQSHTDDTASIMARAEAMMQGSSVQTVAASFEASYAAPPASERKWSAPQGYVPRGRSEAPASSMAQSWTGPATDDTPAVMARVSEMMGGGAAAAAPAPAKKWQPYGGGYDPKNRAAPAAAPAAAAAPAYEPAQSYQAPMTSAPAKKWQPYGGGYDPKNRGSAPAASSAPAYAPAAASYEAPAPTFSSAGSDPLSSAPAKKWQPYGGGYDPRNRGSAPAASSAPAYAPAAASYEAPAPTFSSAGSDPMSSAPAKKWQPYGGGYDPKNRGSPAASSAPAYTHAAAAAPAYEPAQSYQAPASAPAKKWQPYGGYDPKSRGAAPAPAPAAAPVRAFLSLSCVCCIHIPLSPSFKVSVCFPNT